MIDLPHLSSYNNHVEYEQEKAQKSREVAESLSSDKLLGLFNPQI